LVPANGTGPGEAPWLVVGLGNPGQEYSQTWHNLGFLVIDRLALRNNIRVSRPEAKALVGVGQLSGRDAVLAQPQTFMNRSGGSVQPLADKFGVPPEKILVIYDDLDLPWTATRIKPRGSAGGHHGMESIIASLKTQEFPRLRLGINPGHPVNGTQFVLSPIRKAQMEELDELLDHAAAAVESILADGVEKAMTRFNRRARGLHKEEE
jgi:PTH1 family peptidyl-tRNA hydrolase